ncbi:hypothetical protein HY837_03430 [archaeon]|nr:hypothetical protein [archaeon]
MEQKKKRHNPEITQEDLAVKAFDRLDDIVQEAKNSSQEVEAVKTDKSKLKEFHNLISKVFGEEFYKETKEALVWETEEEIYADKTMLDNFSMLKDPGFIDLLNTPRSLWKKKRTKWYKKKISERYITLEINTPDQIMKSDAGELPKIKVLLENGKYSPIKITAHTQEALKESRIFVKAYEKLTGQKATLIQDCEDEEPVRLEKKIQKQPDYKTAAWKKMGKKALDFGNGFFKGVFIAPTAIQSGDVNYAYDNGLLGGVLTSIVGGALFYSLSGFLLVDPEIRESIINNHLWAIPAIHLSTNALSGLKAWHNYETEKLEKEHKKKQN